MSELIEYRGARRVGVEEIRGAVEKGGRHFTDFHTSQAGVTHGVYLERQSLRLPPALEGVGLREISVTGHLPPDREPWAAFRRVLERGGDPIGRLGTLTVAVGFEEKESQQDGEIYDTASVSLAQDGARFLYRANGSRVMTDMVYRKRFMSRVAAESGLPIAFESRGDDFVLSHADGGRLEAVRARPGGVSPCGFACHFDRAAAVDLVDRLADFCGRFGSGKLIDLAWSVSAPEGEESRTIYDALIDCGFPAESYSIDATIEMESLEGLEVLQTFCDPDDSVYTALATFRFPGGNYVNFQVLTTADGHRVDAQSRLPVDIADIGEKLGLPFETNE